MDADAAPQAIFPEPRRGLRRKLSLPSPPSPFAVIIAILAIVTAAALVIIAIPGETGKIVGQVTIRRDGTVTCFGDQSACIDALALVARTPLPPKPGTCCHASVLHPE